MRVCLYGPSMGYGSFVRVTKGMHDGLDENGVLAGFFPIDYREDGQQFYGWDADTAVYVGNPAGVAAMNFGSHKERLCLLPPNSTWVPRSLLAIASQHVTGFIAPSRWAQEILQENTPLPVYLWRHGVSDAFLPVTDDDNYRLESFKKGDFAVLHMASTSAQRKGTRELIQAWGKFLAGSTRPENPTLHLVVDGSRDDFARCVADACATTKHMDTIKWIGRLNLSAERSAICYRQHHLVCQPSRSEGFGLCPLEARACGVPVVMTGCTGHADVIVTPRDSLLEILNGLTIVKTGPYADIDDGPGAKAPSLDSNDVFEALVSAYQNWEHIFHECNRVARSDSMAEWRWKNVTQRWIETMESR